MIPADQSLCAVEARRIALNIILGLIVDDEFMVPQSSIKITDQPLMLIIPLEHFLIIDHEMLFAAAYNAAGSSGTIKQL